MKHVPISAAAASELEDRLRALPRAPGPDERFRAELRVQLMAAVERGPEPLTVPARERFVSAHRQVVPRFRFGRRAVAALAGGLAVLLVITGTTWWLARRALPGDALYGLKRAGESADMSTKQGEQNRGKAYLSLSGVRIDEAVQLVERASSSTGAGPGHVGLAPSVPLSPRVDQLVRTALVQGDTSVTTATRLLTTASVATRTGDPATAISGWLTQQQGTVRTLVEHLPETSPATAGGEARVLQRDLATIRVRVAAVSARLGCLTCSFSKHDRFGPLPCPVCPVGPVTVPSKAAPKGTTIPTSATSAPARPTTTTLPPTATVPVATPTAPPVTTLPPIAPPSTAPPTAPPTGVPPTVPVVPPVTTEPTTPSPTVVPTLPTDTPTTVPVPTDAPTDPSTDDDTPPTDGQTCLPPLCIPAS